MSTKKRTVLIFDGPILTGTISTAKGECGKSNCACKKSSKYHHGTYYRWTGFHFGKRTTKSITKKIAEECEKRIKNYRLLEVKIKKLVDKAMIHAPWEETK